MNDAFIFLYISLKVLVFFSKMANSYNLMSKIDLINSYQPAFFPKKLVIYLSLPKKINREQSLRVDANCIVI